MFLKINLLNEKIYLPIVYILIGTILYLILNKIIKKISNKTKINDVKADKRKKTIVSLVNNLFKYLIGIYIVLSILNVYGVNTKSIIASLGIAAVVIGLAFQDIVKDLLSGISIVFDNEYAVGDLVKINDFTGTVVSLGLRTTKIRAYTGETLIISNSTINEVINYSLSTPRLVIDINVSYDTDINKLEKVLTNMKEEVKKFEEHSGELELLGVSSLDSSSVVYQVTILSKPGSQFALKKKLLKLTLNDKDIIKLIPYNIDKEHALRVAIMNVYNQIRDEKKLVLHN